MMKIRNKKTKKELIKPDKKAQIILNNPLMGGEWEIVPEKEKLPTPPEAQKVSISKTQGTEKEKSKPKNNAN